MPSFFFQIVIKKYMPSNNSQVQPPATSAERQAMSVEEILEVPPRAPNWSLRQLRHQELHLLEVIYTSTHLSAVIPEGPLQHMPVTHGVGLQFTAQIQEVAHQ